MANNFDSNISRKLMRVFLEGFESSRVLSKTVDTQLIQGKFDSASGTQVDVKRPHDYRTERTSDGDISSATKNDLVAGKATATVQDYITVPVEWKAIDEALKMDQLDQILAPIGARMVTDLEMDFGKYMLKNCGLHYGAPGTSVDAWSDVAGSGALMDSIGVPNDGRRFYVMNPFTTTALADAQRGLSGGSDSLVNTAWQNAQISDKFGNLKAITSNALSTRTSGSTSDRAGAINGTPTATYLAHKDTMIQSIPVDGFSASATIKAGDIVEVTGRYRLSLSTREKFLDASGNAVKWAGVVTADVTLDGSGAGTVAVAGPAIQETNGQYNSVDVALADNDVITVLGAAGTVYQPNMFYHKQAFGIASVPQTKLHSTDTLGTTEDGLQIRVSKYSDGDKNKQMVRFDLIPAYATFNPYFAGQGFGV